MTDGQMRALYRVGDSLRAFLATQTFSSQVYLLRTPKAITARNTMMLRTEDSEIHAEELGKSYYQRCTHRFA